MKSHARQMSLAATILITGQLLLVSSANSCALTYGVVDRTPIENITEGKQAKGLQIDFIKAIAKELDCEVGFTTDHWNDLLLAIKQGKIDFVSNATPTHDRKSYAYFSEAYHKDTFAVYVLGENANKFAGQSVTALLKKGLKLGLANQYVYGQEIDDLKNQKELSNNIIYSDSTHINLQKLRNREIDAILEDPFIMSYRFRLGELPDKLVRLNIKTYGYQSHFMFSKKNINSEFVKKFNQALTKVKATPEFKKIWFNLNR